MDHAFLVAAPPIQQHPQDTKKRAPPCRWLPADDAAMVRVLLQEKRAGNETEHGFLPSSWDKVVDALTITTSSGQPKTMIRTIYLPFKELKTSNEFPLNEDEQRFIVLDDAAWERYIETHPHATKFRTTGFPLFTEFEELVGHKRSVGGVQPYSRAPGPASPDSAYQDHPREPDGLEGIDDGARGMYSPTGSKRPADPSSSVPYPHKRLNPAGRSPSSSHSLPPPHSASREIDRLSGLLNELVSTVRAISRYLHIPPKVKGLAEGELSDGSPAHVLPLSPISSRAFLARETATRQVEQADYLTDGVKLDLLHRLTWDHRLVDVLGSIRDEGLRRGLLERVAARGDEGERRTD